MVASDGHAFRRQDRGAREERAVILRGCGARGIGDDPIWCCAENVVCVIASRARLVVARRSPLSSRYPKRALRGRQERQDRGRNKRKAEVFYGPLPRDGGNKNATGSQERTTKTPRGGTGLFVVVVHLSW